MRRTAACTALACALAVAAVVGLSGRLRGVGEMVSVPSLPAPSWLASMTPQAGAGVMAVQALHARDANFPAVSRERSVGAVGGRKAAGVYPRRFSAATSHAAVGPRAQQASQAPPVHGARGRAAHRAPDGQERANTPERGLAHRAPDGQEGANTPEEEWRADRSKMEKAVREFHQHGDDALETLIPARKTAKEYKQALSKGLHAVERLQKTRQEDTRAVLKASSALKAVEKGVEEQDALKREAMQAKDEGKEYAQKMKIADLKRQLQLQAARDHRREDLVKDQLASLEKENRNLRKQDSKVSLQMEEVPAVGVRAGHLMKLGNEIKTLQQSEGAEVHRLKNEFKAMRQDMEALKHASYSEPKVARRAKIEHGHPAEQGATEGNDQQQAKIKQAVSKHRDPALLAATHPDVMSDSQLLDMVKKEAGEKHGKHQADPAVLAATHPHVMSPKELMTLVKKEAVMRHSAVKSEAVEVNSAGHAHVQHTDPSKSLVLHDNKQRAKIEKALQSEGAEVHRLKNEFKAMRQDMEALKHASAIGGDERQQAKIKQAVSKHRDPALLAATHPDVMSDSQLLDMVKKEAGEKHGKHQADPAVLAATHPHVMSPKELMTLVKKEAVRRVNKKAAQKAAQVAGKQVALKRGLPDEHPKEGAAVFEPHANRKPSVESSAMAEAPADCLPCTEGEGCTAGCATSATLIAKLKLKREMQRDVRDGVDPATDPKLSKLSLSDRNGYGIAAMGANSVLPAGEDYGPNDKHCQSGNCGTLEGKGVNVDGWGFGQSDKALRGISRILPLPHLDPSAGLDSVRAMNARRGRFSYYNHAGDAGVTTPSVSWGGNSRFFGKDGSRGARKLEAAGVKINKWPVNLYQTLPLPGFDKSNWDHTTDTAWTPENPMRFNRHSNAALERAGVYVQDAPSVDGNADAKVPFQPVPKYRRSGISRQEEPTWFMLLPHANMAAPQPVVDRHRGLEFSNEHSLKHGEPGFTGMQGSLGCEPQGCFE